MQSNITPLEHSVIIITGPTAAGKTDLSLQLAEQLGGEIINADVGQLYKPLSIGTAKPDWQSEVVPHHGFDLLSDPEDLSVATYRKLVQELVSCIRARGHVPIIVGGSQFYLKSLFFPLDEQSAPTAQSQGRDAYRDDDTWEHLQAIDPQRAQQIHPNDVYRIARALAIWRETGKKPSDFAPTYKPLFNAQLLFVDRDADNLQARIEQRTHYMIQHGWIAEVERLLGTPWEQFLLTKRLIGYPEIIAWLRSGKQREQAALIKQIVISTRQYAKRQRTFWRSFGPLLTKYENGAPFQCTVHQVNRDRTHEHVAIINQLLKEGRG